MSTLTKNENGNQNTLQRYLSPRADIHQVQDAYVLQVELPGVNRDGLGITIDGTQLTILARRAETAPKAEPLYRESIPADFRRVFELDPAIDTAKVDAKLDQGVLTLRLPKSDHAKPRKVAING